MTPAINLLKKQRIAHQVHSYEHDARAPSYGLEAAQKLGLLPERVFKTLLACTETGELLVAVLPVHRQLNLKALAACAGVKKAEMADPQQAQRATGYVVGGSVLWHRKSIAHFFRLQRRAVCHCVYQCRASRFRSGVGGCRSFKFNARSVCSYCRYS